MAVILGVFFMFMIKCCGGCLVWSLIIGFFAVTAGFGGFCFYMYENPSFAQEVIQDKDLGNLKGLMWLAIAIWTIDVIALLVFICFFKSIRIAIAVIKATAAFIDERLMVISVPFIMFGWIVSHYSMQAIYFVLWVLVSAYIYSSGTPAGQCNGSPYGCMNWDNSVKGCLAYYIIGLFWYLPIDSGYPNTQLHYASTLSDPLLHTGTSAMSMKNIKAALTSVSRS